MNIKEEGKRKGGFTCIEMVLGRKREDGYGFEAVRRWNQR